MHHGWEKLIGVDLDRASEGTEWTMTCEHKFDYVGNEKDGKSSNRYFRCSVCGCVKVRSDDGAEYLIPGSPEKEE